MKKIILIHVFSFLAISAMCQKMESAGSTIDGRPAAPKAATVVTGKAYANYVAPAVQQKQVNTQQPAKPIEKPIVLPTGGNAGGVSTGSFKNNTPQVLKTAGTSPFPIGATAKPAPVVEPAISIKGTSADPNAFPKADNSQKNKPAENSGSVAPQSNKTEAPKVTKPIGD